MRIWQKELCWMLENPSIPGKHVVFSLLLTSTLLLGLYSPWAGYALLLSILSFRVSGFLSPGSRLILVLCSWVYPYYCSNTSLLQRNIDALSHIEYIKYLVHHGSAPSGAYCLVCHHPPLYQAFAAPFYAVAELIPGVDPARIVQFLSVPLALGFCIACSGILQQSLTRPRLATLGTALCAFWPYNLIMSGRVHNDVMANLLMAWTIFTCQRFYQAPSRPRLIFALILAIASVLTKMSGVTMIALVGATCLARSLVVEDAPSIARFTTSRFKQQLQPWLAPLALSALVTSAYLAIRDRSVFDPNQLTLVAQGPETPLVDSTWQTQAKTALFGTAANAPAAMRLESEPLDYLYFDLFDLLENPYAIAKVTGSGGDLFWNHFIKSSLFSTHSRFPDGTTSYRLNRQIASVLLFLELALIAQTLIFVVTAPLRFWKKHLVLGASTAILLSSAFAFRVLEPASHHSDFRHVFAVLAPCLALYLASVGLGLDEKKTWGVFSVVAAVSFCILSAIYFIPKQSWRLAAPKTGPIYQSLKDMDCSKHELETGEIIYRVKLEWGQNLQVTLGTLPPNTKTLELVTDGSDSYTINLVGSEGIDQQDLHAPQKPPLRNLGHRYLLTVPETVGTLESLILRPTFGDHMFGVGCIRALEKP